MRRASAAWSRSSSRCRELDEAQIAKLAPIPTLMVFGDYLDAVPGSFVNWQTSADSCQDKNSDQIAALVMIDEHVER